MVSGKKKNPQIWLTLSLHVLSYKKDFSDLWLLGLKGVVKQTTIIFWSDSRCKE